MLLTTLAMLACGQAAVPPAHWMPRGCRDRSCWTPVGGRVVGGGGAPVFSTQEIINFGPTAGGPAYAKPTFAGDADLAYLFTVQSDCTVKCTTDDQGTTCPGIVWAGGSGATCRRIWTGDYALTDISNTNCWHFSGMTRTPANVLTSDFAVSVFGYPTLKEAAVPYVFQVLDGSSNGFYIRYESGAFSGVFFEGAGFPTTSSAQSAKDGFQLITAHRLGTHHNINANGGSENGDVVASNAMTPAGTLSGGIGCDDTRLGNALGMGGQWAWAAIYKANKTPAQSGVVVTKAVGFPNVTGLLNQGTGATVCIDPTDGGTADCVALGLPIVTEKGYRAWSGERTMSKWAADPLDVSSWTLSNASVATNVKQGPFYEVQHSAEMDRLNDFDAVHFGYAEMPGNGFVRGPMNYTACAYLSAGDGGTSDKARLALVATNALFGDGGQEVDCNFSGLTPTPTLMSCTALLTTYDGGVTVRGRVEVGNVAADTGSITVGHARLNAGVTCEPPVLSNGAVGNSYLHADISAWHSDSSGGAHEIVWTPLATGCGTSATNSPYGDWIEAPDTIYLHDAYDNSNNHIVTYLYGYTFGGHVIFRFATALGQVTDLLADNVCLTPNTMYATRAQWTGPTGGTCALAAKWDTCNGSVASCIATTTQISGSGACPDQPSNLNVPQRYDVTVPTDAWILSVRHLTP